jgi:hypothetical protein
MPDFHLCRQQITIIILLLNSHTPDFHLRRQQISIIILHLNSHMPDFHLHRQQITIIILFLKNHMPDFHLRRQQISIIILFLNSHMPHFHLGRQQITISYNCMYQIHNMVLTNVYHFQNYPILTVICCRYIIVMQPKQSQQSKTTSFEQQILCSLLNSYVC